MPKASNVAGTAQHLVPVAAVTPRETPSALICEQSGAPCPALTALFGPLAPAADTPVGDQARAWVMSLAPCSNCRVAFESGQANLRKLRLGQREREILIAASGTGVFVVTEPGMSRSLSAARRRAALSLGKAGLVTPVAMPKGEGPPGVLRPPRATVTLTDLGRYVMAAYGRYLKGGKPIRWTRPARGITIPGRDPSTLRDEALCRTQSALRDTLNDLKGVLIAAITKPRGDASKLDAVTRHLEHKATLLKAVLEPARAAPAGA
jgi:hypothetical protein